MSRSLTINEGTTMLVLPDGEVYSRAVGDDAIDVLLTDAEWDRVSATARASGLFTDNGAFSGTYLVVVDAGVALDTDRPAGAAAVLWKFDAGVDVGVEGANVTNAAVGDLYTVASA